MQSEKEAALRSQKEEEAIETMMNDDGPQLSEREFDEEEDEEMAMAIEMGQLDKNGDAKLDDNNLQEQGAEEESQPVEAGNLEDKAASDDNNTDSNVDAPTTGDDTKLEENDSESPARLSPAGSVVTPLRGQTEAEMTSNNSEDAQGGGSEVLADHDASSDPFANDEDVAASDGLEEKADAMKQDLDQTVPLDIKKTGVEVSKDKEPPVREGVAESNMSEKLRASPTRPRTRRSLRKKNHALKSPRTPHGRQCSVRRRKPSPNRRNSKGREATHWSMARPRKRR